MARPSSLKFSKSINVNIEAEQYAFLKEKDIPISSFIRSIIEEYKDKGHMIKQQQELQKENRELKRRILELEDEIQKIKPPEPEFIDWT